MSTSTVVWLLVGLAATVLGFSLTNRNPLIVPDGTANRALTNVQAQYERRLDRILQPAPNGDRCHHLGERDPQQNP